MAEEMRLQKYLALCGVASRRASEDLIKEGRVSVNGNIVQALGTKIVPETDVVAVDGQTVVLSAKKVYVVLNKPKGYVTTAKDNFNRKTVLDLLPKELGRIYPVGRLDYDSEGLLLLTNDGDFTLRLTHPRHEISKTYLVTVTGAPSPQALNSLRQGVLIDERKTLPASVTVKSKDVKCTKLLITIREGRNRQVRKMCSAVGHDVISLCRVAIGSLQLGNLPTGAWRHLTKEEIQSLGGQTHANHKNN